MYDDAVRRRLLDLTARRLADGGEPAVSLRDLVREAGTSTSAVYALFGSRDRLVEAVRAEAFTRFAAALDAAGRTGDPGRDLLELGLAYRSNALAEPHLYRVMFAGAGEPAPGQGATEQSARTLGEPTFVVLRTAVARVVGADAALEVALRVWALAHGLVSLELAGQLPGDAQERADRYADALAVVGPLLSRGS
ncbi:transcriptional regulator, TetR family [Beutenbergia cavernae DSM 12333]|uniref:Transcriptional regulator, TetR family n=1 Tax=Beutenbergia cavernae (strain ATCC BAA-8 / DSM 12333 / CCUG 43141 / JCM 11478 / NBRC 16432 / NCIMB 13614 / HKI 0122) TaxID=471853 RepID=C5BWP8_BEUC1|nr:transcriptional regulator, TetR family [Beutenbergia cavernae DSM 12333]